MGGRVGTSTVEMLQRTETDATWVTNAADPTEDSEIARGANQSPI